MSQSIFLTCEEIFRLLDSYIDDEITDREARAVDNHLKDCEVCAKIFQSEKEALQQLRKRMQSLDVPGNLIDTVLKHLDKED